LLFTTKAGFIHHFNTQAHKLYGTTGNAYAGTLKAGAVPKPTNVGTFNVNRILLLIPLLFFFNLWSNWGAPLYGEVRGGSDFRKNVYAMGGALIFTTVMAVIFFLLFAKTFGWHFYEAANYAYGTGPIPVTPYPGTFAAFILGNPVLQFIFITLLSLWF